MKATFDPNDYKDDIIRLVQAKHGRTLAIPGNIKLMFYPRIGANLGRVTLSERGGEDEFAAIDSARFSVALLPLLQRNIVIDRIDVRGMQAKVIRNADGSMNTGDLTSGPDLRGPAASLAGGQCARDQPGHRQHPPRQRAPVLRRPQERPHARHQPSQYRFGRDRAACRAGWRCRPAFA
ncbi:AsmA family protein [Massilia sp. B-10]|nr:AsmA family protein [Massilia sp. B-10]